MDFFTSNDGPISINIDGNPYTLQRFLLPAMKEWAASIRKQTSDEATSHLDADAKARFLTYFQPPAIDVMQLAERVLSPEGGEYVCKYAMKKAGVADDVIKSLLASSDPLLIRKLADELATASRSKAEAAIPNEGASPLTPPAGASGDSPATSATTTATSAAPTSDSTQTA